MMHVFPLTLKLYYCCALTPISDFWDKQNVALDLKVRQRHYKKES